MELLCAVSNAGALGSFGAHYLEPEQITSLINGIRHQCQKSFNINLWVSDHDGMGHSLSNAMFELHYAQLKPYFDELGLPKPDYPEQFGQHFEYQVEALLRAKPPVFSFVYGIPDHTILAECRKQGIVTIGTAITLDEVAALGDAGVDAIVATGFEAGGHRVSFLREAEDSLIGTFSLIPQAVDLVKTPIIAAGGIADRRGVNAAFALGAQAIQIGTAFLACEESGAAPMHRDALFSDAARYTTLTRAFTGRLARSIENRILHELRHAAHAPYPAQSWFTGQIKKAAIEQNRPDLISLWCSQSAGLLTHRKAANVIHDFMAPEYVQT